METEDTKLARYIYGADRRTLEDILLRICSQNEPVRREVASLLHTAYSTPFAVQKTALESFLGSAPYGYLERDTIDEAADALQSMLLSALAQADIGQVADAAGMVLFVLEKIVKLEPSLQEGDELYEVQAGALDTLRDIAENAKEADRPEVARRVLEAAESGRLYSECSGNDTVLEALAAAAPAASPETKDAFLKAIGGQDQVELGTEESITWRDILRYADGPQTAHDFMLENLDVDEFRLALVDEAAEKKDFDTAERLCRERLETPEGNYPDYRTMRWNEKLYDILAAAGNTEKRTAQALLLVRAGNTKYYEDAKQLLTAAGRWEQEYPDLLTQISEHAGAGAYMEVLYSENEAMRLLQAIRKNNRGMIFKYGKYLSEHHPAEVREIISDLVRDESVHAGSRVHYTHIAEAIEQLAALGWAQDALDLIRELTSTYSRRWALKEELSQAAEKIRAGKPDEAACSSTHWR